GSPVQLAWRLAQGLGRSPCRYLHHQWQAAVLKVLLSDSKKHGSVDRPRGFRGGRSVLSLRLQEASELGAEKYTGTAHTQSKCHVGGGQNDRCGKMSTEGKPLCLVC